jgi:hypothetical protein
MATIDPLPTTQTKIHVYLDDGRVFTYEVDTDSQAREHADAIIKYGYRHTSNVTHTMEVYPAHRIVKIKCVGGMSTYYPGIVSGT